MDDNKCFKLLIEYQSSLIDKSILLYLNILIKNIFLSLDKDKKDKNEKNKKNNPIIDHLNKINNKINSDIIKDKNRYIDINAYSINNLKNIIYFVRTQNRVYTGDIIEGILIIIFSKAFKTEKTDSFGKILFNNMSKINDLTSNLNDWFSPGKKIFKANELKDIKNLLIELDSNIEDANQNYSKTNDIQKKSPFFNFFSEFIKNKYNALSEKNKINIKTIKYINKGDFDIHEKNKKIYDTMKNNSTTISEKDIEMNSLSRVYECLFDPRSFEGMKSPPIMMIRSFIISVYIYYQNKNSPLMKRIKKEENKYDDLYYEYLPFTYDLKGACIEGRFANIIVAPIRIEPRIEKINFCQNNLRENGLFEISKSLLFNKSIKKIDYNISVLRTYFLDYFNYGLGIFDNYSIEELNISYNYIKEDCDYYLAKLLSHLKGLKTINLSSNDLESGAASFFIMLKKLYRKGKIKLENLFLAKCFLDDTSFYELGELLKSKYCKLKRLYLTINNKPSTFNFLKKIKKNRSLIEINFNRSNYGIHDTDDIYRIISNTNIKYLSFFRNRILNFDDCIRIIYRTKLIKTEKEKDILDNNIPLLNLDLSNNEPWIQYPNQVKLIYKISKETTLGCLDISHILYGLNPEKSNKPKDIPFKNAVEEIKKKISEDKKKYKINLGEKMVKESNINQYRDLENDKDIINILKTHEETIEKITDNENAFYPVYLREQIDEKIKVDDEELEDKIVNYMIYKASQKELIKIEKKLNDKKLIII